MRIEIAFATPEKQVLLVKDAEPGTTAGDIIERALGRGELPREAAGLELGIWGRVVERSRVLRDGDRVELYRPLKADPREARRRYAESGETMAGQQGD